MSDHEPSIEDLMNDLQGASNAAAGDADDATVKDFAAIHSQIDAFAKVAELEGTDPETYAKLIAAVEAATANNNAIAELKNRVEALGTSAKALWDEVKPLVGTFL